MFKFVCIISVHFLLSDAARILLMIPVAAVSHQLPFRPLAQELARRGHEVVVVTSDPAFPKDKSPSNLTEIDARHTYSLWQDLYTLASSGNKNNLHSQLKFILELFSKMFEVDYQIEEFQNIVRDRTKHFDLLLLQECSVPTLGLAHIFKVPVIQISSFSSLASGFDIIGAQTQPLLYPKMFAQRVYNLTFGEKISELYNAYKVNSIIDDFELNIDETLERIYGAKVPTLKELKNHVAMSFINVHPLWEDSRPVPPGLVFIGGIHQRTRQIKQKTSTATKVLRSQQVGRLPQRTSHLLLENDWPSDNEFDLQNFLDKSKNGVIYVSFGTKVDTSQLPTDKVQAMIEAFSELPYGVLWKWSTDEMPGRPNNIKISKWFPQPDILRHPSVKLFVTQGGLQSTEDALIGGVPLIGIPMYADQWFNAEKYKKYQIGLRLDMEMLTAESFKKAIKTVINNESYRQNIVRLRSWLADQPQTALDRAVWWVEHVLKHGGTHLRSPSANMHWTQYYEIELLCIVFLTIAFLSLLIFQTFKIILRIFKTLRIFSCSVFQRSKLSTFTK